MFEDTCAEDSQAALPAYEPRTPLGRRLWESRARIVAGGEPQLGWEALEREAAERRGAAVADIPADGA